MRTSAALLLVVAASVALAAGQAPPARPFSWSDPAPQATPFPSPSATPTPLPDASIAEPFAIGEALYDPGRVADGVMSLLARMGIGVSASASSQRLTLDESEVRTLIALAEDDLRGADDLENLPFGFVDLHRAISGLLPDLSIEELAETYTRVYAEAPDGLVAKVMMGQPLDPETRLTRVQIWLLLMDGFAAPDGAEAAYGAADRVLPDVPSPNPAWSAAEWREALARLPLVPASRLVAIEHGTGAATLRRAPQPPPLLSRLSGKPLLAARAGSLAGQAVTWEVAEGSSLRQLATLRTPVGQPATVGANGASVLSFQPIAASAGTGEPVEEWVTVGATLPACPLVSSAYDLPRPMCDFIIGSRRIEVPFPMLWRTTDKRRVAIVYRYALQLQTPIGGVSREGLDGVDGWIVRRPDGTYTGTMVGSITATQEIRGSDNCGTTMVTAAQELHVEGRMLRSFQTPGTGQTGAGLARTRDLGSYHWATPGPQPLQFVLGADWNQEPPAGGYLVLEFFPKTFPRDPQGRPIRFDPDACLPLIAASPEQSRHGVGYFVPFNDAQWTTPDAGYAIGLRQDREYYFVDDNNAVGYFAGRELDFSVNKGSGTGRPRWTVRVQRSPLTP